MKIEVIKKLMKNKQVIEEINKHLWIESQKAGYSIGLERATDEWVTLYAKEWMKYNMPGEYKKMMSSDKKKDSVSANKATATDKATVTKKKVSTTKKTAVKKDAVKKRSAKSFSATTTKKKTTTKKTTKKK